MPTTWQLSLLPASWRGVPFGVKATGWRAGRRAVTHQYPFRDQPYTEDLGRSARQLTFSGFVIGDDAAFQASAILNACEQKGPGELVHPVYGSVRMQLVGVESEERWDNGRVVEFRFQFVEPGEVLYPTSGADTQAASNNAVDTGTPRLIDDYTSAPVTSDLSSQSTANTPGP